MDGFLDDQTLLSVLGRSDFVSGIENEGIDFSQLEDFINNETDQTVTYFGDSLCGDRSSRQLTVGHIPQGSNIETHFPQPHNLPESPPDSGSEPPYSPPEARPISPRTHVKVSGVEDLLLTSGGVYSKLLNSEDIQQAILPHSPPLDNNVPSPIPAGTLIAAADDGNIATVFTTTKKRKLSQENVNVKQEPVKIAEIVPDDDVSFQDGSPESGMYMDASSFQCIRFQPFQQTQWHTLCDHNLKELPIPHFRVDADKGFNFSNTDDAFVCQKKNHFQITCHCQLIGNAHFVKTAEGLRKIDSFFLHFYGVKVESPSQMIKVEQSQSDRSKKAFHPVLVDLKNEEVTKVTVGRLHFSETTSNNMRKKGKPNPDQRYFYLVVGLHAHCTDASHYPITSHSSERIIVRASNPGQFESDGEAVWQRGATGDSVFHCGRVGINTERPDEALVVHGNIKLTGHIVQPSDIRAKAYIQEVDSKQQLKNLARIRVVKYRYKPEFAQDQSTHTGLIAQELVSVLPDAVSNSGTINLPSGNTIQDFLVIDKERVFMENIGAVKELAKVTTNLQSRLQELERVTQSTVLPKKQRKSKSFLSEPCSDRVIHGAIFALVVIMAVCLISMAALYFFEIHKKTQVDQLVIRDKGEIITLNAVPNGFKTRLKPSVPNYSPSLKQDMRYSGPPILGTPPHCSIQRGNCQDYCCGLHASMDSIQNDFADPGSNLLDDKDPIRPEQQRALWLETTSFNKKPRPKSSRESALGQVWLEGRSFNWTLSPQNCDRNHPEYTQCTRASATNYSYLIPVSRFLQDSFINIHFRLGEDERVTWCGGFVQACGGLTAQVETLPGSATYPLVIQHMKKVHRVFRVAPTHIHDICSWESRQMDNQFTEFNLVIYRDCVE